LPLSWLAVSAYLSECVGKGNNRENHADGNSKADARPRRAFVRIEPKSEK
jgi:hypothetical protein